MSKTATTSVDRLGNEQLLAKAQESAGKLWLFGLGAYSLATKSSVKTVETLLREGKALQPKARQQIEEKSAELKNTANAAIQRGEQVVQERFLRPLDFVLLATRRDIEQLSMRVIELSDEVHKLATGGKALKSAAKAATTESTQDHPLLASRAELGLAAVARK